MGDGDSHGPGEYTDNDEAQKRFGKEEQIRGLFLHPSVIDAAWPVFGNDPRSLRNFVTHSMAWKDTPEATRGLFWLAVFVGVGLLVVIVLVALAQPGVP
jgi:hypothetical protein